MYFWAEHKGAAYGGGGSAITSHVVTMHYC